MANSLSKAKKIVGKPFSKSIETFMDKTADVSGKIQDIGDQISQLSLLLGKETFFVREIVCTAVPGSGEAIEKLEAAVHSLVETMRELVGAIESLIDSLSQKKFIQIYRFHRRRRQNARRCFGPYERLPISAHGKRNQTARIRSLRGKRPSRH